MGEITNVKLLPEASLDFLIQHCVEESEDLIRALIKISINRHKHASMDRQDPQIVEESLTCKTLLQKELLEAMKKSDTRDTNTSMAVQKSDDERDKTVDKLVEILNFIGTDDYLQIVASHRKWIMISCKLMLTLLPDHFNWDKIEANCQAHDLSKYCSLELVGYTLKWGPTPDKRKPADELWHLAYKHHVLGNLHHPEFHHSSDMSSFGLVESLIDMLACRMERQLAAGMNWLPEDVFNIDQHFLKRYSTEDKEKIIKLIECSYKALRGMTKEEIDILNVRTNLRIAYIEN